MFQLMPNPRIKHGPAVALIFTGAWTPQGYEEVRMTLEDGLRYCARTALVYSGVEGVYREGCSLLLHKLEWEDGTQTFPFLSWSVWRPDDCRLYLGSACGGNLLIAKFDRDEVAAALRAE